jgi:hypothetical protein
VEWDKYLRFWKFYPGALIFHKESSESTYKLIFGSTWPYVIFAKQNPAEFQGSRHYLQDAVGGELEPVVTVLASKYSSCPYSSTSPNKGGIFGATLVTLLSLMGIVVLFPFVDWFPFVCVCPCIWQSTIRRLFHCPPQRISGHQLRRGPRGRSDAEVWNKAYDRVRYTWLG